MGVYGLEFTDTAAVDPSSDGSIVYTRDEKFTNSSGAWTWSNITRDDLKYPDDQRASSVTSYSTILAIRNISGQKFMYTTDQYTSFLAIYRLDGNGKFAPAGMIVPRHYLQYIVGVPADMTFRIWTDANGDGAVQADEIKMLATEPSGVVGWGWDVDLNGDVYQAVEGSPGVRKFSFGGLNSSKNPIYASYVNQGVPAPFTKVERAKYDAARDVMWISGYTKTRPQQKEADFGLAGTEMARYEHWSKGKRTAAVRIALPYDTKDNRYVKSIAAAGDRVFAGILRTTRNEGVHVYDGKSGTELGVLTPKGLGQLTPAWIDGAEMIQAFQRANGETMVLVEDDLYGHVLLYRVNQR